MEAWVAFLTNHWVLSALFVVAFIALMANEILQARLGGAFVTPEQAVALMNRQGAIVFDIRDESAFSGGHILGSIAVPANPVSFEAKMGSLKQYSAKPIVLACEGGQKSLSMSALLKQKGFANVLVLRGGIQNWRAAGLPLTRS